MAHCARETTLDADFFKLGRHALRTPDPARTDRQQPRVQRSIAIVKIQPDDVNLQTAPFDRNFDPVDEQHPGLKGNGTRVRQAFHIIVIGQRQNVDTVFGRSTRDLGWRQKPVRRGGMAVKVDNLHRKKRRIGKKSSPR